MTAQHRLEDILLFTLAGTDEELESAMLLIESIREFGGQMKLCPIWLFDFRSTASGDDLPPELGVRLIPSTAPDPIAGYELADKVHACAEAERLAPSGVRSLVWLSPDNLVINPPILFNLDDNHDVAVRPVHIKNVGLAVDEPPNEYWARVYRTVGIEPPKFSVESYVDGQLLTAYFNSHSYCVRPSKGLFRRWVECFETLVLDREFQSSSCSDELHRIFLHQAVLSTLTVSMIDADRIRVLPPSYCYPYNLQSSIRPDRRAVTTSELVSITYEDRSLNPEDIADISLHKPLKSWLSSRVGKGDSGRN